MYENNDINLSIDPVSIYTTILNSIQDYFIAIFTIQSLQSSFTGN